MSNFESGDALALYNVDRWGGGYFGINADGHVVVKPKRNGEQVDLMENSALLLFLWIGMKLICLG